MRGGGGRGTSKLYVKFWWPMFLALKTRLFWPKFTFVSCKLHGWNVSLRLVSVGRSRAWWDHGIGGRRWFIPRRHTGQDVVNPSARGAWMRRLQVSGRTTGIAAVVVLSLVVRSSRWLARCCESPSWVEIRGNCAGVGKVAAAREYFIPII